MSSARAAREQRESGGAAERRSGGAAERRSGRPRARRRVGRRSGVDFDHARGECIFEQDYNGGVVSALDTLAGELRVVLVLSYYILHFVGARALALRRGAL